MRRGGIYAVSFRDIAAEIGIKARRFIIISQPRPISPPPPRAMSHGSLPRSETPRIPRRHPATGLGDGYIGAFRGDAATCLCTVLGAVSSDLATGTSDAVTGYCTDLRDWLWQALDWSGTAVAPDLVISILQGSMVLTTATGNAGPMGEARVFLLGALRA